MMLRKALLLFLALTFAPLPCSWAATVAYDKMTDTAGTAITAHTPTDAGTGWTQSTNSGSPDTNIDSGGDDAESDATGGGSGGWDWCRETTDIGDDDMDVSCDCNSASSFDNRWCGCLGRMASDDSQNFYRARQRGGGEVELEKIIAGSRTELGNWTSAATGNDLKLEIRTATKKVYTDAFGTPVERISSTDDNLTGNNYAGFFINHTSNPRLDDFFSESVAAATFTPKAIFMLKPREWIELFENLIFPEAYAQPDQPIPQDGREAQFYISQVCGTGVDDETDPDNIVENPRRPCLTDLIDFKGWVLVWDGGTQMIFKGLATPDFHTTHPGIRAIDRIRQDDFPQTAKNYVANHGMGTIDRR